MGLFAGHHMILSYLRVCDEGILVTSVVFSLCVPVGYDVSECGLEQAC